MRVTPRDEDLYEDVYRLRDASAEQLFRLHRHAIPSFTTLQRRLGLGRTQGFLTARRLAIRGDVGALPYRYSIGPKAVRLVAERLGVDEAVIRQRQRQDERLSDLFAQHRSRLIDLRIAFLVACRDNGYPVIWRNDEEIAALRLSVEVGPNRLPVRPDAFFAIDRGDRKVSAFLVELQLASNPVRFKEKAAALMAFFASGAYTATFEYRSLRVLAVADTPARALHLKQAAEQSGGTSLFWSAAVDEVLAAPLSAKVWWMGGCDERMALFADEGDE